MANFDLALADLLTWEGGYTNNPNDAGGETYAGISRKNFPMWLGWQFVDEIHKVHTNLVDLNRELTADSNVQVALAAFYRQKFWNFDTVPSQLVANKMFEMEVQFGPGTAVRILQQGLVRLGHPIAVDGSLGSATLALVHNEKEPDLLHALRAFAAVYRVHRVQARPDQLEFVEGWLWRDTA